MSLQQNEQRYLNICFHAHQPHLLRRFRYSDKARTHMYFDDSLQEETTRRVAAQCYVPANNLILKLIDKYPGIRITFCVSGVLLEALEKYAPEALESFRRLASSNAVEFLAESYYHSLAFLGDRSEFVSQVNKHVEKVHELFGVCPSVFRNTALFYSDTVGTLLGTLGFKGVYLDDHDRLLNGRTPHQLYKHPQQNVKLFLRDHALSDASHFFDTHGMPWLTAAKYIAWLERMYENKALINVAMKYETFGMDHHADKGIFQFLEDVLTRIAKREHYKMVTPSEALQEVACTESLSCPALVSAVDEGSTLSSCLGNEMQRDAFDILFKMYRDIKECNNNNLLALWRHLQTSDHFYYMSTMHAHGINQTGAMPYASPYEAYMNYMNVLTDLGHCVKRYKIEQQQKLMNSILAGFWSGLSHAGGIQKRP